MAITYDEKSILGAETTGSAIEVAGGVAVIVLAIIGLARGGSAFMAAISTIVLGAALLAFGGMIAAEYSKLLMKVTGGSVGAAELGGGMTVEILVGGGTVVLGILALIGYSPQVLVSAAVIAVGTALILGARGLQRLNSLKLEAAGVSDMAQRVAQGTVAGATGSQVLAGAAAIVLGILGLTLTSHPAMLSTIGVLVLGAGISISGAALTGRFLQIVGNNRQA